jgi:hypothetical protein
LLGFKSRNEEWNRLPSLAAESGIMVRSLKNATTECEVGPAYKPDLANRLEPRIGRQKQKERLMPT